MVTPNFNLCDICGDKVSKDNRLYAIYDSQPNGAGASENVGEYVDLCPKHMKLVFEKLYLTNKLLEQSTIYDRGQQLIDLVKLLTENYRRNHAN